MKNYIKKIYNKISLRVKKVLVYFGLVGAVVTSGIIAGSGAQAVQVTVPSAPGANYVLISNSTGNYSSVATTSQLATLNLTAGVINATTTATSTFGGDIIANLVRVANDQWILGRNAANSANINMFRVNALNNKIEYGAKMYFSDKPTISGYDRGSYFTVYKDTPLITAHQPMVSVIASSSADYSLGTTTVGARGTMGFYTNIGDTTDVTSMTKGSLYGFYAVVRPMIDRNDIPYDDAVGVIVANQGIGKGTDAIYVGNGTGISSPNPQWANGLMLDVDADNGIAYSTNTYLYGIDMRSGTFSNGAIRLPNNSSIVGRNQANSANIPIASVNTSNSVVLNNGGIVSTSGNNTGIATATPSSRLEIGDNTATDEVVTVRSLGRTGLKLFSDTANGGGEPGGSYVYFGVDGETTPAVVGITQTAGQDPAGVSYTGLLTNSMTILNKNIGGIIFGTKDSGNVNGVRAVITPDGRFGIGTTTPTTHLQVTATSTNATSTVTVGKTGQNKGSCLELFDAAGTAVYAYVAAGATTFTLSAVSCK